MSQPKNNNSNNNSVTQKNMSDVSNGSDTTILKQPKLPKSGKKKQQQQANKQKQPSQQQTANSEATPMIVNDTVGEARKSRRKDKKKRKKAQKQAQKQSTAAPPQTEAEQEQFVETNGNGKRRRKEPITPISVSNTDPQVDEEPPAKKSKLSMNEEVDGNETSAVVPHSDNSEVIIDDSSDESTSTSINTNSLTIHSTSSATTSTFRKRTSDRYFIEESTNLSSNNHPPLTFVTKDTFAQNCTLCGFDDHEVYECPQRFCSLCNRRGHESSVCPNKKFVCEWCTKCGHTEDKCPLKEYTISMSQVTDENLAKWGITKLETNSGFLCCEAPAKKSDQISCFNCGGLRHFGLQCPRPSLASMMNSRSTQNKIMALGANAKSNRSKKLVHHLSSQFIDEF